MVVDRRFDMQVETLMDQARDTITVKRVFGEPIEKDGITIIPVANVMGGAGGGRGEGPAPMTPTTLVTSGEGEEGDAEAPSGMGASLTASGSGAGFGVRATPAGAYVIRDGEVSWQPAMDLTRIAIMGQIVAIVFLLVMRSILKSRS
jgi:uncharacterized spore protein YtfJ